ncbi:uncharacterized protein LOC111695657 [Eurytemora carolleeae]|uniref:uncharacterized protein LOC111695657 n=1 Tax=Eurytemora carolleeae TaxID=1294199 RepID=UPI000C77CB65|nr:uncharacterized protein LOC111695657 [Eurytemora carolleeae]|eukprot:XP_023320822.1 uncharacterized protein LOC111695657 [Eurytemora affinis]
MVKLLLVLFVTCAYSLPKPDAQGEEEYVASETAQQVGETLNKLPSILSKTAEWIRELANIGDEVHPSVGSVIRDGADSVKIASDNVPEDLDVKVQTHLRHLIDIAKKIQVEVKTGLTKVPELKDNLNGTLIESYVEDVVDSVPSAEEVDARISDAINYLEPLAEALAVQNSNTTTVA